MFEKLGKNPEFQKVYKQGRSKANFIDMILEKIVDKRKELLDYWNIW